MEERKKLKIGAILYIVWAIMGAWMIYEENIHPYIPEHGFILFMGIMPFAIPIVIFIGIMLEDV